MSHLSAITLDFGSKEGVSIPGIVRIFLDSGWNLNNYGHITYLRIGKRDDFDWDILELDKEDKLFDFIQKQVEAGEYSVVALMWKNSKIGMLTIFDPDGKQIEFIPTINRRTIKGIDVWTDASWYLLRIVRTLQARGISIGRIEFYDDPN